MKNRGIDICPSDTRESFSTRLILTSAVSVTVTSVALILLFEKQLHYMAGQESLAAINAARLPVIAEGIFVAVVILGYLLTVFRANANLLDFYLNNQRSTLMQVSDGQLDCSVPVICNDEFGEIARHTNAMLRKLEERGKEVLKTQDAAFLSLATLAETRDNETGAHIMRTQRYVGLLADQLSWQPAFRDELTPKAVDMICKSTPLHDIGKVGIPDSILLKPGKLTDQEYAVMKTHTLLGSQALEAAEFTLGQSHFLSYAKDLVATHHERWDGTGYPAGLSGTDIPLCGRLMAVADVYDALVSARVYKSAFSHEKARDIIVDGSGSHFDPDIVEAFLACEQDFVAVAYEYKDASQTPDLAA